MNTLENNAFFWQKLDTLYLSSKLIVDRPKGTCLLYTSPSPRDA